MGETKVEPSGTSVTTVAFAPIFTLWPIVILPIITAPVPINILLPRLGAPGLDDVSKFDPIVTLCIIIMLSPNFACPEINTPKRACLNSMLIPSDIEKGRKQPVKWHKTLCILVRGKIIIE